jgi:5-methylcytosine-specific restriction endonuclease McrA
MASRFQLLHKKVTVNAKGTKNVKTTDRGYGWSYQKRRAEILSKNPKCHICGKSGADSIDHVPSRQDPNAVLKPCHVSCNSARGVRQREAKRGK